MEVMNSRDIDALFKRFKQKLTIALDDISREEVNKAAEREGDDSDEYEEYNDLPDEAPLLEAIWTTLKAKVEAAEDLDAKYMASLSTEMRVSYAVEYATGLRLLVYYSQLPTKMHLEVANTNRGATSTTMPSPRTQSTRADCISKPSTKRWCSCTPRRLVLTRQARLMPPVSRKASDSCGILNSSAML